MKELLYKIITRFRERIYKRKKKNNFMLYSSYWHYKLFKKENIQADTENMYLSARPNPGAGIGHQIANWMAGYCWALEFHLKFAHQPFSNSHIPNTPNSWEEFLNFGSNEKNAFKLLKSGYKKVRLPKFNNSEEEIEVIKGIIHSYSGKKIVFFCECDQFYKDLFVIQDVVKEKFFGSPLRQKEKLIYSDHEFNVAIHVRRGDIVQTAGQNNPNLTMRYQTNSYFYNALNSALDYLKDRQNIHVYLFSQGKKEEFSEFENIKNITYCLDLGAKESFLHMIYADALITSKSSFSYKPALINKGIKFCPNNFWHGYPKDKDWIMLDEDGNIITGI